jgi:peptide/nickel transport system permease protein
MFAYIVKRILVMVPTLFAILLLVFLLVNIAPGSPGESLNVSGSEDAQQSAEARESYRRFREQYNLDKPILLNFRFRIDRADVVEELEFIAKNMAQALPGEEVALGVGRKTASVTENIANKAYSEAEEALGSLEPDTPAYEEQRAKLLQMERLEVPAARPARPDPARYQKAESRVGDWGMDIVPELVAIASDYLLARNSEGDSEVFWASTLTDEALSALEDTGTFSAQGSLWDVEQVMTEKVRFLAVQRLSVNAKRRVIVRRGETASPERRARNDEILAENREISDWTYELNASESEVDSVVSQWTSWLDEHRSRFERTTGEELGRVFLDTRFARYFGNLMPVEFSPRFRFRAPDLGSSMRFRKPVTEVIGEHWQYSVFLSVASLLLAYFISVPIGVLAAVRQNGPIADRGVGIVLFILYSLPNFFTATILQSYLTASRGLDIFPVTGFDSGEKLQMTTIEYWGDVAIHLVLPVFCLTYVSLAALSRYARSGLLEVIRSDYIRTARAKGLSEWIVIIKHAVRNGMIPIITLLGSTLPVLIGGSIIIEYIFGIKGMGALMLNSIHFRDYNVIMGILLLSSILTLIGILLSDIAYSIVDPRIDLE